MVNYVQWANREQLAAAHHSDAFRETWPEVGNAAEQIGLDLYEVAHVEA